MPNHALCTFVIPTLQWRKLRKIAQGHRAFEEEWRQDSNTGSQNPEPVRLTLLTVLPVSLQRLVDHKLADQEPPVQLPIHR